MLQAASLPCPHDHSQGINEHGLHPTVLPSFRLSPPRIISTAPHPVLPSVGLHSIHSLSPTACVTTRLMFNVQVCPTFYTINPKLSAQSHLASPAMSPLPCHVLPSTLASCLRLQGLCLDSLSHALHPQLPAPKSILPEPNQAPPSQETVPESPVVGILLPPQTVNSLCSKSTFYHPTVT